MTRGILLKFFQQLAIYILLAVTHGISDSTLIFQQLVIINSYILLNEQTVVKLLS